MADKATPVATCVSVGGVVDKKKSRQRPGCMFLVALSLVGNEYGSLHKEFLFSLQHYVSVSITDFCIAIEKSVGSKEVDNHLHAYLNFSCKPLISFVRECILSLYPGFRLDIQSVKSRRNVL